MIMFEEKKYQDKTEIHKQNLLKKQDRLVKTMRVQRGHTMWEYNIETGEIKPASYANQTFMFSGKLTLDKPTAG